MSSCFSKDQFSFLLVLGSFPLVAQLVSSITRISFIMLSSVLGGVKWYLEITHRYLELLYLHFQHLEINFSNCSAGTITKHIKPSIFLLDINMKLHWGKPYDNYISLANIYCIFDILIIKQLNPSFQLDMNAWFFL